MNLDRDDDAELDKALEWSRLEAAQRDGYDDGYDDDLLEAIKRSTLDDDMTRRQVLVFCHPEPPVHSPPLNEHGRVANTISDDGKGLAWLPHFGQYIMMDSFPDLLESDVHYVDPKIPEWCEADPLAHKRDGFSQDFLTEFAGRFDCVFMLDCDGPFSTRDGPDATKLCQVLKRCMKLLAPGGKLVASKFLGGTFGDVIGCLEAAGVVVVPQHNDYWRLDIMTLSEKPATGGRRAWNFGAQAALLAVTIACSIIGP